MGHSFCSAQPGPSECMRTWGLVLTISSPYYGRLANPIPIRGEGRLCLAYKVGPNNIFDIPAALSAPLLHFFLGWSIKSLSDIQRQEQQFSDDDDKENKFHMSKKWQCLTFFCNMRRRRGANGITYSSVTYTPIQISLTLVCVSLKMVFLWALWYNYIFS